MTRSHENAAPEGAQLSAVRQKRLLEIVRQRNAVSIRDLCDYLQVSDATVRRDVTMLDRKGLLSRTHGGVVANSIVNFDLPQSDRVRLREEEKARIGGASLSMLQGDETVLIDAGTTALSIAMGARQHPGCTYVTTSLGAANILKEQGLNNYYLLGGAYLGVNDSFAGSITIAAIRNLSFDIAFLSVSAIDIHRRAISLGNEAYAQVQREILAVSRKNVVVADHTKFKASAFSQTATFEDLDAIVTDTMIDETARAAFDDDRLELILA